MNLQRYAELARVLEPYGARLLRVEGATLTYAVTGNRDQLRAQLSLAKLQELPAEQVPATPAAASQPEPGVALPTPPRPFDGLRFRW